MFMFRKLVPRNQKGFIQYLTVALHQVEHLASLEEVDFLICYCGLVISSVALNSCLFDYICRSSEFDYTVP